MKENKIQNRDNDEKKDEKYFINIKDAKKRF
jgi:hypothetical protein